MKRWWWTQQNSQNCHHTRSGRQWSLRDSEKCRMNCSGLIYPHIQVHSKMSKNVISAFITLTVFALNPHPGIKLEDRTSTESDKSMIAVPSFLSLKPTRPPTPAPVLGADCLCCSSLHTSRLFLECFQVLVFSARGKVTLPKIYYDCFQ